MSRESLREFCEVVRNNRVLQDLLQAAPNEDSLVNVAVSLARDYGFDVEPQDVRDEMSEASRRLNRQLDYPVSISLEPEFY